MAIIHDSQAQKQIYLAQLEQLTSAQKQVLAQKLNVSPDKTKGKLVACVTMVGGEALNSKQLKEFAQASLPEHFTPQIFRQVEALPKTAMGKVDRKNAQCFTWQELLFQTANTELESKDTAQDEDDFDIFGENTYIAPTNETEELLAKIWSDVLGIDDISIHDEFIEVGGDSLFSIRILARINKAGLNIAAEDFFEYPTIAGQAKAISKASENSYEKGSTKGTFGLIPIQHWLFERVSIDTQHWNQSVLLAVDEKLNFPSLERAFQKVLLQHDALRLAFVQDANEQWQQAYMALGSTLPIDLIDCTQQGSIAQSALIEQHCKVMNNSMDLAKGNLARLGFFETKVGEPNALAIVVHHLIIDAESWRILLEDLQSCWLSFSQGTRPSLPSKTTSYKHWFEKLSEYGQSPSLLEEVDYWDLQKSYSTIPVDFTVSYEDNVEGSASVVSTLLDIDTTGLLLHEIPKKLKVEVRDVLVSALAIVLQKWTKHDEVLFDIEGHGREGLFDNVDISRTIGWFTTVFPTVFKISSNAQLNETLLAVKSTLKAIPKKGIGHGVLLENNDESMEKQQAYSQVCFNYLGQIDAHKNDNQAEVFSLLKHNVGATRSAECLRAFYLEVNAKVQSGQLHISWSYSNNIHKAETIEQLAHDFGQVLNDILALEVTNTIEDNDDDSFDFADFEDDEMDAITKALSGNM